MNDENENLYFVFPENYDKKGTYFGIIHKSGVILACIWLGLLFVVHYYLFFINIWVRFITFITIGFPVAIYMLIGLNGDPILMFLRYIRKFRRNKKKKYIFWRF